MIGVVFFDAAGTLFHLPRGAAAHYQEVAARRGCTLPEAMLHRAFHEVWQEMPARPSTGRARPDDDRGWWRELVGRVLDRCAVSAADLDRDGYFDELYAEFALPGVWQLFPEVREVLLQLRGRFRLGIISNFDGRLRPILRHLGVADYFDPLIISSEVGADKPHPWIFESALASAGCAPSEALHVGDDPVRDWDGAARAGLAAFHLARPANSLRDLAAQLTAPSAF